MEAARPEFENDRNLRGRAELSDPFRGPDRRGAGSGNSCTRQVGVLRADEPGRRSLICQNYVFIVIQAGEDHLLVAGFVVLRSLVMKH